MSSMECDRHEQGTFGLAIATNKGLLGWRSPRTRDFWTGDRHEQGTFGLATASPKVTFTSQIKL
ncbi:hypothetical protein PN499_27205 [Kamptonema animale CS-326]|uniref:hypothetical protein n=1 Tax=Kamptonema animale TaxID=92934 RepID=UPI00232FDEB0|nr:hypothetical protein [Kamptonema animale]MDB9514895.1 hypothetical protein [Kamptonema animale CS-326]